MCRRGKVFSLLLCFLSYLDLWLVASHLDPTSLSISSTYGLLLKTPVFHLILFIGSYSLLMVGFFPALRGLFTIARLHIFGSISISNVTKESKQLSDWAAGFVCFSGYGAIDSFFLGGSNYQGLANYMLTFSLVNSFVEVLLKVGIVLFWLYCVSLAIRADDWEPHLY